MLGSPNFFLASRVDRRTPLAALSGLLLVIHNADTESHFNLSPMPAYYHQSEASS
jgi:hypothetical protein